jgi:SsrA-binding protein
MDNIKIISRNRKARHDYELMDTFEAGLVLTGSEIKSIRAGRVNIRDGFVHPRGDELWLLNVHIAPYEQAGMFTHDPRRPRKLLLHRREIDRIVARIQEKGLTVVPTMLYLTRGIAKVEIALARGKRQYDKRRSIRERESQRQIERSIRERYR